MVVKPSTSFLTGDTDSRLIVDSTTVVTSMTGNDNYLSPSPTLPIVTTAISAFSVAIANAADGGRELTSAKNAKRNELVALLRLLVSYVAIACGDDMTKLLSSGFPVQKPNRTPAPIPSTPLSPKVSQGRSGEAAATAGPVAGAYIYNWRVALASAPSVYIQHAQSTGGRVTFEGLTPGQTYLFSLNAVGTAGTSDWSDEGRLMVV